ncbi:hypothetical protein [Desulfosporosinus fructosivorans]
MDTETYMNELSVLAYKTFEEATKEDREKCKSSFLYCKTANDNDDKVLSAHYLYKCLTIFALRHIRELDCINRPENDADGYFKVQINAHTNSKYINSAPRNYWGIIPLGSTVCRPNPHQYRVTVCNELFKKGVHYDWIRKHMNHLSSDMTDWYLRKEDIDEVVVKRKEDILIGLVKKDFRLVGKNAEELMAKVDDFIQKGNYNIVEDRPKLLKNLKKQLPLREKALGFCIKSSFAFECKTNEFFCAYDKCFNHYTYYKVADLTYKRYVDKKGAIRHNQEHGFKRQVENETVHLKELITKRLIPELEEVRYEIDRQGLQRIIEENPNLEHIVDNLDDIMEEVTQWIA